VPDGGRSGSGRSRGSPRGLVLDRSAARPVWAASIPGLVRHGAECRDHGRRPAACREVGVGRLVVKGVDEAAGVAFQGDELLGEGGIGHGQRSADLEGGRQRHVEASPHRVVADERVRRGGGGRLRSGDRHDRREWPAIPAVGALTRAGRVRQRDITIVQPPRHLPLRLRGTRVVRVGRGQAQPHPLAWGRGGRVRQVGQPLGEYTEVGLPIGVTPERPAAQRQHRHRAVTGEVRVVHQNPLMAFQRHQMHDVLDAVRRSLYGGGREPARDDHGEQPVLIEAEDGPVTGIGGAGMGQKVCLVQPWRHRPERAGCDLDVGAG
jgi:hypothetical protein